MDMSFPTMVPFKATLGGSLGPPPTDPVGKFCSDLERSRFPLCVWVVGAVRLYPFPFLSVAAPPPHDGEME